MSALPVFRNTAMLRPTTETYPGSVADGNGQHGQKRGGAGFRIVNQFVPELGGVVAEVQRASRAWFLDHAWWAPRRLGCITHGRRAFSGRGKSRSCPLTRSAMSTDHRVDLFYAGGRLGRPWALHRRYGVGEVAKVLSDDCGQLPMLLHRVPARRCNGPLGLRLPVGGPTAAAK